MKIYLAGPLFTEAERTFNKQLSDKITQIGHIVYLPQEFCSKLDTSTSIFDSCREGVERCDTIIAILDGADADSGTCWEVGYAYARNKKIIGIRTDFRQNGDTRGFNAMLLNSLSSVFEDKDWESYLLNFLTYRVENEEYGR